MRGEAVRVQRGEMLGRCQVRCRPRLYHQVCLRRCCLCLEVCKEQPIPQGSSSLLVCKVEVRSGDGLRHDGCSWARLQQERLPVEVLMRGEAVRVQRGEMPGRCQVRCRPRLYHQVCLRRHCLCLEVCKEQPIPQGSSSLLVCKVEVRNGDWLRHDGCSRARLQQERLPIEVLMRGEAVRVQRGEMPGRCQVRCRPRLYHQVC